MEVKTQAQFEQAQQLYTGSVIWLGGNDIAQEGNWVWYYYGDQINMNQFWRAGHPQSSTGHNCLVMQSSSGYENYNCDATVYYSACEYPISNGR